MRGTPASVFLILIILLIVIPPAAEAGVGKIIGTITDAETGEPIRGVSVTVVGTDLGAITDSTGRYSIGDVAPGTYEVRIFHIDYGQVTVTQVYTKADINTEVSYSPWKDNSPELDIEITVKHKADQLKIRETVKELRLPGGPPSSVFHFQVNIGGVVRDATTDRPLQGVTVAVVGTNYRGLTDKNGTFWFGDLPHRCYEVVLSCKGYETVKIGDNCSRQGVIPMVSVRLERLKEK